MAKGKPLLEATLELQRQGQSWCRFGGECGQMVRRALNNLVDAVTRLGEGKRQRVRARRNLINCFTGFELLFCEREMMLVDFHEACRRVDQIFAAVEKLPTLPVEQWTTVELPPLAPPTRHPEDHPAVRQSLESRWRADEALEKMREPKREEAPKPEPEPEPEPPPLRGRARPRLLN